MFHKRNLLILALLVLGLAYVPIQALANQTDLREGSCSAARRTCRSGESMGHGACRATCRTAGSPDARRACLNTCKAGKGDGLAACELAFGECQVCRAIAPVLSCPAACGKSIAPCCV